MALEGAKLLHKILDGAELNLAVGGVLTLNGDNWSNIGSNIAVNRAYFDLSGYDVEDLTLFVQNVAVQEGQMVRGSSNHSTLIDLVTTEFVDDAEIIQVMTAATTQFGFNNSELDMNQIVYGAYRLYIENTNLTPGSSFPILHAVNNFGIGNAVARSKLYITRIAINHDLGSIINIPEANYVVGGLVSKEKELSYIQRLKLNYEHANR